MVDSETYGKSYMGCVGIDLRPSDYESPMPCKTLKALLV